MKSEEEHALSFKNLSFLGKVAIIITFIVSLPVLFVIILNFLYSAKDFRERLDFIFGCLILLFLLFILFRS